MVVKQGLSKEALRLTTPLSTDVLATPCVGDFRGSGTRHPSAAQWDVDVQTPRIKLDLLANVRPNPTTERGARHEHGAPWSDLGDNWLKLHRLKMRKSSSQRPSAVRRGASIKSPTAGAAKRVVKRGEGDLF